MKFILTAVLVVVIAVVVGLIIMYAGWTNVAALGGHSELAMWFLDQTMTQSVKHHAKRITPPPLDDPNQVKLGFMHYDDMCVTCHGAPGVGRSEIGAGLHPGPPSLAAAVDDWTPAELFWITKNGVMMTGMPGFGKTHTDAEIWAIVAFLRTLPTLEPKDYLALHHSLMGDSDTPGTMHEHHGEEEHGEE